MTSDTELNNRSQSEIITRFYSAFQDLDGERMVSCYHDEIEFTDPAFGTLKGERARSMWLMLCANARDFSLTFNEVKGDAAKWEARYTFSQTGRKVHNCINARFEFKEGKIVKHIDDFDLHRWATQALGLKGWLLGNTNFFKKKLQQQTNRLLDKFTS